MKLFIGRFGRILIPFHATDVTLAGEKRAPETIQGNDSLNKEARRLLALISRQRSSDLPIYDGYRIHL